MAAEGRAVGPALDSRELREALAERPFLFEFFQAVRLVEQLTGASPVGRFAQPQSECVRFEAHNSTTFPASEIQEFEWREGRPPRMGVNFMGLTGPLGVLPLYYTRLVIDRARARDTGIRDFLDIFNHRMVSLFYRAWEKYRFTVEFARSGSDQVAAHLRDAVGVGTGGLQSRQPVPDHALIFYSGLIAPLTRSATALKQLLEDYFDVPVEIVQFAGGWSELDRPTQTWLEEKQDDSQKLAFGAMVGDEVWDEQSRVRIRLGPLTLEQYRDFLPAGSAYEPLRSITRFFRGTEVDFEVQLVLARDEVPGCELGREDEGAAKLGWSSWAKTAEMNRDPEDTILEL